MDLLYKWCDDDVDDYNDDDENTKMTIIKRTKTSAGHVG
jgi:hypothetical protein